MNEKNDTDLEPGDLVEAANPREFILHCGSGIYSYAVVVSTTPFALVSESGDMLWIATIKPEFVRKVGKASLAAMSCAMQRWNREKRARQL